MEKIFQIVLLMVVGLFTSVLFSFVSALIIWPLWNWLMPEIFGLCTIGYWQAFGLSVLSTVLLRFTMNTSSKWWRGKLSSDDRWNLQISADICRFHLNGNTMSNKKQHQDEEILHCRQGTVGCFRLDNVCLVHSPVGYPPLQSIQPCMTFEKTFKNFRKHWNTLKENT